MALLSSDEAIDRDGLVGTGPITVAPSFFSAMSSARK
jgi:hypothetical protein